MDAFFHATILVYKIINKNTKRLDNLYVDKLDGSIAESEYDKFYTEFKAKLNEARGGRKADPAWIEEQIKRLGTGERGYANGMIQLRITVLQIWRFARASRR